MRMRSSHASSDDAHAIIIGYDCVACAAILSDDAHAIIACE